MLARHSAQSWSNSLSISADAWSCLQQAPITNTHCPCPAGPEGGAVGHIRRFALYIPWGRVRTSFSREKLTSVAWVSTKCGDVVDIEKSVIVLIVFGHCLFAASCMDE